LREHPTPESLERFLRGELPADEGRTVLAHLVRGCRPCQAAAAPLVRLLVEDGDPEEVDACGGLYDEALDRVFAAAGRAADCRALLRRSHELRHDDPAEMLQLAQAGVQAAQRLDPSSLDPEQIADLQARAWAQLGNAERVTGNLAAAEGSLEQAHEFFQAGTGDPLLEAQLLSIRAALLAGQRRFLPAMELLERVEAAYSAVEDRHELGRALVQRGLYTCYVGRAEEAVPLLRRGLDLIDEAADPQLALAAVHNLARSLAERGHLRAARTLLGKHDARYARHAGRIDLLKRTWLEGQIADGLGELDRATVRLTEALDGFEEAGLGYQAALAALDLSAVWLRRDQPQAAAALVEEAFETFKALGIGREALAAFAVLQEACERGAATAAIVRQVAAFFRRLEHDPQARFTSSA
jgi:tetratricopeptide (TPR) repeat protein